MKPLGIFVMGSPIPATVEKRGDFAALVRGATSDAWPGAWQAVECRAEGELPDPHTFSGIVLTGSASSVTAREPWVLRSEAYLRRAVADGVPVLGICFGHQILGQALGGRVELNPRGREIGTVEVELVSPDPLLDDSAHPFVANMTHVDAVVALPPGARVLARTPLDPHAALRFADQVWGVQFHPEIDADVMRDYVTARRDAIAAEGLDVDAIEARIADAAPGAEVLRRFARHVAKR